MILRLMVFASVVFLMGPLFVIILFSFNDSTSLSFPFSGFSLRWYHTVVADERLLASLRTSLLVGGVTSVLTVFLGLGFSLLWLRLRSGRRAALELLCITPIALPGLFVGVALLIFFAELQLQQSWITITIAHILLALPVLAITMRARLALYDVSLEEAARDLGASQVQTMFGVTLPIIAPYLFACGLMAFAISFDEFVLTFFVSGTETTVPMFIWSMMRRTVTPLINAISTITLLFTIVALTLAWVIVRMRRRRSLEVQKPDDA